MCDINRMTNIARSTKIYTKSNIRDAFPGSTPSFFRLRRSSSLVISPSKIFDDGFVVPEHRVTRFEVFCPKLLKSQDSRSYNLWTGCFLRLCGPNLRLCEQCFLESFQNSSNRQYSQKWSPAKVPKAQLSEKATSKKFGAPDRKRSVFCSTIRTQTVRGHILLPLLGLRRWRFEW